LTPEGSVVRVTERSNVLKATRVARMSLLCLVGSVALAAFAQWILLATPTQIQLPRSVDQALAPMWPQAGPVTVGAILFVASLVGFGQSARRLSSEPPTEGRGDWALRRTALSGWRLGSALVATGLFLLLVVYLALGNYHFLAAVGYLVVITLLAVPLILSERSWIAPKLTNIRSAWLEVVLVTILLGAFIFLNRFDAESWYYSAIGDEHSFFEASGRIAQGKLSLNIFTQKGAYDIIPALSSYVDAFFMRIFGTDGAGWKSAIAIEAAAALLATYLLARYLFNPRVAMLALGMLATSHYLLAYAHTGYPNLQALFPGIASLLFLSVGIRERSPLFLALAGATAGLGWYTYYPSRCAILVLGIVIICTLKPRAWICAAVPAGAGFLALFLPLVAASGPEILTRMLEQTGAGSTTEAAANRALLPIWNLGRSLLAFNYNTHEGPYLWGSLAEPITATLFILGLGHAIATQRERRMRALLSYLAVGLFITGVLSKYDYVSVSRMNYLLPVVAILAAVAVEELLVISGSRWLRSPVLPTTIVAVVLAAVSVSNLHRWFVVAPARVPTSSDTVVIRLLQDGPCRTATGDPLVIDVGMGGRLAPALTAYPGIRNPVVALYGSTDWIETAPTRCVIFRSPNDQAAITTMNAIRARWPQVEPRTETDVSGKTRLTVFYPV